MKRYFLHVCNGSGFTEDEEGHLFLDDSAARLGAIDSARCIMASELRAGELDLSSFIEVEDAEHRLLFTVAFADTVKLKHRHGPAVEV